MNGMDGLHDLEQLMGRAALEQWVAARSTMLPLELRLRAHVAAAELMEERNEQGIAAMQVMRAKRVREGRSVDQVDRHLEKRLALRRELSDLRASCSRNADQYEDVWRGGAIAEAEELLVAAS